MQEIPYQPIDGGSYEESEDKFKVKIKDDTDDSDGISKEHKPVFCRGTNDMSKRDGQESRSTDRHRIKRKRDSGSDVSDNDSDEVKTISCEDSSSTNKDSNRSSFYHKRPRQSPNNTKDDEDSSLAYLNKPDVDITILAGANSPIKDRNEMLRCDILQSEITNQVQTHAKIKSENQNNLLSENSAQSINSDTTKDKTEQLTFLHESSSIDTSLNAAEPESLDLDEFTLRSQKDRYDALEREYQHDGIVATELSLSDEFTCDTQSFESL